MCRTSFAGIVVFLALCNCYEISAQAPKRTQPNQTVTRQRQALTSGIFTSRFKDKDWRRWEAMKRIIFATDAHGQPLHPTLYDLWEELEQSGHLVYLEMREPTLTISSTAGSFHLKQFDPQGCRHVAVIKLDTASIDQAYVGPLTARANGFIPFRGLTREERYVEVLGHELAHAVWILNDLARAQEVYENIERTNQIFLADRRYDAKSELRPELRQRITKRDLLLQELEQQAETVEYQVWQELTRSQAARERQRKFAAKFSPLILAER